jgi:hypothetical protein
MKIKELGGMHLNYYPVIQGTNINSDVSIKFGDDDFKYMQSTLSGFTDGYVANKFYVLVQKVESGQQPTPDDWKLIDMTSEIPNHVVGDYIDPINMRGNRFVITEDDYLSGTPYDIEDFLGEMPNEPSTLPEFGDEQPFPGSIKLIRATDLEVMKFLVNLPEGTFDTTQNPSWSTGKQKRITEIVLLNENKDVLVIGKTPKPIVRTGTQVFAVKIDL